MFHCLNNNLYLSIPLKFNSAYSQIVKNIRNNVPGALERYFDFLKIGNKLNPIESLKVAGVDFTSTEVFDSAVEMFDNLIDEFDKLYKEVYKK